MKTHEVVFVEYIKEGENFIINKEHKVTITYKQSPDNHTLFEVSVNGYMTGVKIDSSNINQPMRKKIAEAYKKYKKIERFSNIISKIHRFDDRDELTELELYKCNN